MVKTHGFHTALLKWNAMLKLKQMPGQRNFEGDVFATFAEKKKARKAKIGRKRK